MPPEGLRPAQLGVVLVGRVVPGHIGATIADLAARGYLRLEGSGADWVLTDSRPPAALGHADLLGYERELLTGLFGRHREAVLAELGEPFARRLDRDAASCCATRPGAAGSGAGGISRAPGAARSCCRLSRSSAAGFAPRPAPAT